MCVLKLQLYLQQFNTSLVNAFLVEAAIALQFFIRDDKLQLVANMRSSDLVLGISYDVPAFTFLQELMARELGIEVGTYIHVSNSLHVYEKHFDLIKPKQPFLVADKALR